MKEFKEHIWVDTHKDGTVSVGLTQNFIETKLTECFHIMQADAQHLKKDGPMLVIETNDGLSSLKSPVSGRIISFNDRARNFPDKLKEDDVIMKILPEGVKQSKVAKEAPPPAQQVMWRDEPDPFEQVNIPLIPQPVNPWPAPPNNQEIQQRFLNIVNRNARRPR